MENLRHLLATIAALTLVLSVVSGVSPVSFTGLNAFAEDDDGEDNDHSGSSSGSNNNNNDDEDEEYGNQTSHGAKDDEERGNHSSNSTGDDKEDDDNNGKDHGVNSNNDESGQGHEKSGLHVENDGIQVNVEMDTNMTDGTYGVAFICDTPAVNKTLDSMFEVEHGKGVLEAEIALENGTYSGCELVLAGTNTAIASFDSFTVQEDVEQEDDDHENERHQERRHEIVSNVTGHEIHERHIKANPSSPGDYRPGWNYTLMADGTAMNDTNSAHTVNATVDIDMAVWKSTPAIILLDITGGTVQVGGHEYDVRIGYALYSTEHGVMRLGALVSDDSGNILKLKLYGNASG
ncbi:MAG TPA: hypothetical protein VHL10_03120, partial [Nitrososphaera sp.]|nr:hypothetical protein [Nitrososphaera sp.]